MAMMFIMAQDPSNTRYLCGLLVKCVAALDCLYMQQLHHLASYSKAWPLECLADIRCEPVEQWNKVNHVVGKSPGLAGFCVNMASCMMLCGHIILLQWPIWHSGYCDWIYFLYCSKVWSYHPRQQDALSSVGPTYPTGQLHWDESGLYVQPSC